MLVAFGASVLVFAASWMAGADSPGSVDLRASIFATAQLELLDSSDATASKAKEPANEAQEAEAGEAVDAEAAGDAATVAESAEEELPAVPAKSGTGRRVVFDQTAQRVWLVLDDGTIDRTYLVSGSRFDNLQPGSYRVESRSRHAVAFDNSGTMEYFIRFATGWRAPIGFHSIPKYLDGTPEQTEEQLGTRLSAGCVRQKDSDAKYLWDWAPVGTPVTVVA